MGGRGQRLYVGPCSWNKVDSDRFRVPVSHVNGVTNGLVSAFLEDRMEPKGGGCSVEIQILCEVEGLVCGSCSLKFVKHKPISYMLSQFTRAEIFIFSS